MACGAGGGIQCILGKKGVAGGGEQRYVGRNGLTLGGGAVTIPIAFAKNTHLGPEPILSEFEVPYSLKFSGPFYFRASNFRAFNFRAP